MKKQINVIVHNGRKIKRKDWNRMNDEAEAKAQLARMKLKGYEEIEDDLFG